MTSEIIVVEREFEQPMSVAEIEEIRRQAGDCLDLYGVRYLHGFLSSDGRRMICTYQAADAESVRQANRQARVPFSRVWTARHVGDLPIAGDGPAAGITGA